MSNPKHTKIPVKQWVAAVGIVVSVWIGYSPDTQAKTPAHRPHPYSCTRVCENKIAVRKCYRQGPSIGVCRALVRGARRAHLPIRWAYDPAAIELLRRESTWNPRAVNSSSGACGLFQFLPCRCWPALHAQVACGWLYIRSRYGSPSGAIAHHNRAGWY